MCKMREDLKAIGFKEEIDFKLLQIEEQKRIKENLEWVIKEFATIDGAIDWEKVSLYMQFTIKIFPTGWEKLYKEINK